MQSPKQRVAGIGFDHMHIGDMLMLAAGTPGFEVVGAYDDNSAKMNEVCDDIGIDRQIRYTNWEQMLESARPDIGIVCAKTSEHSIWAKRLAERGVGVLIEKPFAVSVQEARQMIDVAVRAKVGLAVNWPLAWYASHRTTARLIHSGEFGKVLEVHYYDGNRGPQFHLHAKKVIDEPVNATSQWWFNDRAGGGSLRDYLGYGANLATWFRKGEMPDRVSAIAHVPEGYEVDLQSIVVASYESGLSSFQTRWGTFTDPWNEQPQPFCGFTVVCEGGTIVSQDYARAISIQTRSSPGIHDVPVDNYDGDDNVFHALARYLCGETEKIEGPCGYDYSLAAQIITDAADRSRQRHSIEKLEPILPIR